MMQPDYADTQHLLAQEHSLADAAEAHGTLAGCLCGASGYRFEDWLKEILPEGRATGAATHAPARTLRCDGGGAHPAGHGIHPAAAR